MIPPTRNTLRDTLQTAFPKATITPLPGTDNYRIRIPGSGRGHAGGPWAIVKTTENTTTFQIGLYTSPPYSDYHSLINYLSSKLTTRVSTYT